jgi:hypothetical protein
MTDGFMLATDLAKALVQRTEQIWCQTGDLPEPVEMAWRRIFKRPISMFVMAQTVEFDDGSFLVVRLHPEGRVVVVDPNNGASIRVLPERARELVGNIGTELASFDPFMAYCQSHGIGAETRDAADHHARVGGATFNFLAT